MGDNSDIEWTDASWNPTRGCSLVSPGCANCYAMRQAYRFGGPGKPYEGLTVITSRGPRWTGRIRLVPEALTWPIRKRRSRRIFVDSMSDLFHEDVPDHFIHSVWVSMALSPQHTFQILTKRPERMEAFCREPMDASLFELIARPLILEGTSVRQFELVNQTARKAWERYEKTLSNVWLGTSIEGAEQLPRAHHLTNTIAAHRFLSLEPLLGPLDQLRFYAFSANYIKRIQAEAGHTDDDTPQHLRPKGTIDWVIVGGESGPRARPCDLSWIRSIVSDCADIGVPCFVKQIGANPRVAIPSKTAGNPHHFDLELKSKKGADPSEWPEDLRVQELPPAS